MSVAPSGTVPWPEMTTDQFDWLVERGLIENGPTEWNGREPESKWRGERMHCWKEQAEAIRQALTQEGAP